jgi:hypothetical protein
MKEEITSINPKDEAFKIAYLKIEEKYINLFKERPSVLKSEPYNRLKENFYTLYTETKNEMSFYKNTWVPDYIQNEVITAFKLAFSR